LEELADPKMGIEKKGMKWKKPRRLSCEPSSWSEEDLGRGSHRASAGTKGGRREGKIAKKGENP